MVDQGPLVIIRLRANSQELGKLKRPILVEFFGLKQRIDKQPAFGGPAILKKLLDSFCRRKSARQIEMNSSEVGGIVTRWRGFKAKGRQCFQYFFIDKIARRRLGQIDPRIRQGHNQLYWNNFAQITSNNDVSAAPQNFGRRQFRVDVNG